MRTLLLGCLLLSVSAQAQDAAPRSPTTGQRVVLVVAAVGGGVVTVPFIGPFAPVGVAAATYGTSAALGFGPSLRGVALDTAYGALIGTGTGMGVYLLATEVGGADNDFGAMLGAGAIGLVVGAAATGYWHGRRIGRASCRERV